MRKRPLCAVVLCFLLYQVFWLWRSVPESGPPADEAADGSQMICAGVVCRREETEDYHIYYLKQVQTAPVLEQISEKKILVYDQKETTEQKRKDENEETSVIRIGNRICVTGELDCFESATNPGMFDQKAYYWKQKIRAAVWAEEIQVLDDRKDDFREELTVFRLSWSEKLRQILGKEKGQILCAMLLGEKS